MKLFGKRLCALGLTAVLVSMPALAETDMSQEFKDGFVAQAKDMLSLDLDYTGMYKDAQWTDQSKTFPASYDLREKGVVPTIRNQGKWGTCWGFASIAASEISILSDLGLTTEEYLSKYGKEMNLSEKHLAWFTSCAVPDDEAQGGEGVQYLTEPVTQEMHYNMGGIMGYASTLFSAGVGPVTEELVPYKAADGTSSTASDWTLPEEQRYFLSYELEDSAVLPSPATRDENGNYVYNEMGTQAIKQELLAGRGVSVCYHADQAMDSNARQTYMIDDALKRGLPQEMIDTYQAKQAYYNEHNGDAFTDEEYLKTAAILVYMTMNPEMTYEEYCTAVAADPDLETQIIAVITALQNSSASGESAGEPAAETEELSDEAKEALRAAADAIGISYDKYIAMYDIRQAANNQVYINTATYAQYTDNPNTDVDHAVCIVGWDDNYDVSNFPADHQPPANGAWIVRNSWGEGYQDKGYLYISYYDQSLCLPETFDFITDGSTENISGIDINAHDMMPCDFINSVAMDEPAFMANVYTIENEEVLSAVSVMTAAMNADITLAVYLLNEDAASPVDGTMLDTVTASYQFGGYHRVSLHQNYLIPAGSKISIVQLQRASYEEGTKFVVPFSGAQNKLYTETLNSFANAKDQQRIYRNAVIGKGESYIKLDGSWADWADVIDSIYAEGGALNYLTFDNLSMKAYLYMADELDEAHNFGEPVSYCGAKARICEDCGYTIVEP